MAKTVVGVYDEVSDAQAAVEDLGRAGFPSSDISLLSAAEARRRGLDVEPETRREGNKSDEGAGLGAGAGAVVGGLGGLLVGLGTLLLPGLGLVLAAGPLVTTLIGAGIGAGLGALVGALIGLGIPEEEAHYYAEAVRRGGTLVAVDSEEGRIDDAIDVMERHNPVDIRERAATWRREGWTPGDYDVRTYETTEQAAGQEMARTGTGGLQPFETFDTDYRSHYDRVYGSRGRTYDYYRPAYRYGYSLANDWRYRDRSWADVEADARRGWEESNVGLWDDFREAVHEGWESAKGGLTRERGERM